MKQPTLPQLPPEDAVVNDGFLRSQRYDDIYFSHEDGLAETRHVFIDGTGLRERLAEREHLLITETGFGTGLNFLAVVAEVLLRKVKRR